MSTTPEQISKIRKQVEFYFSDSNLPFDRYLWNLTRQNEQGWVEIAKIASFKRMQMITTDLNTVIEALRSEPSDLIELDEKNENIRRKKDLVEQNFDERSLYAKGFPLVDQGEDPPKDCLYDIQDKITEFFEQYGRVLAVRLRKTYGRPSKFKGSVFVEFSAPEEAKKVADMTLQYEGQDLLLKTKGDYEKEKAEKYKDAPEDQRRRSGFNAFKILSNGKSGPGSMGNRRNGKGGDKFSQKGGARGQNVRSHVNHRLVTFANAQSADDEVIKSIVGAEDVASITRKDDGSGYVLLNKSTSREKVFGLRAKPAEELKGINFRFADNNESAAYQALKNPAPQAGEKRKAEDDE